MKIAVVCAHNIDKNPGMVSVDRAAMNFFDGRDLEIDWLIAGDSERHNPGVDNMPAFKSVFDVIGYPETYDRIVFWGDFLQSRTHHVSLIKQVLKCGHATDADQAMAFLRKKLLFEDGNPDTFAKVVIFGSTIHADSVEMLVDEPFRRALTRLFAEARSVRMREPVSSYRASMLSGRDGTVGMDAAFLNIEGHSWNVTAAHNRCNGPIRIAVVGGRSGRQDGRKLKFSALATLRAFERLGFDATLEVLPWLSSSLGRWGWFNVEKSSKARSPDYCLDRLNDCDALITDVYHAAVNGWVSGIPVVMLGKGAELDRTAIKSKKKELLSLSLFAGENYVFYEAISYIRFKELGDRLRGILTNEKSNRAIFEQRTLDVARLLGKLEREADLPSKENAGTAPQRGKSYEMPLKT
jgi:hypothetical protein